VTLIYIALLFLTLACVSAVIYEAYISVMQRRGIYPKKNTATMADVERLATTGHYYLALHCYRKIVKSSLRDASLVVTAMTSGIQEK
jgi:hypothetical protein